MERQIVQALTRLGLHYQRPTRSAEEQALWLADYVNDLGRFGAATVDEACRRWRVSGKPKFPTVGELVGLCQEATPCTAECEGIAAIEHWRQLQSQEYESLPFWDKVAWHEYAALDAERAATSRKWRISDGNMAVLRADPEWSRLDAERAGHAEEADRLRRAVMERREV